MYLSDTLLSSTWRNKDDIYCIRLGFLQSTLTYLVEKFKLRYFGRVKHASARYLELTVLKGTLRGANSINIQYTV